MAYSKMFWPFLALFVMAGSLGAQQFNSVPLGHTAYDIIEMGILRGMIMPPPSAKPWSEYTVTGKLREMLDASAGMSSIEADMASGVLASFEREPGLDYTTGRYRSERTAGGRRVSFDAGLNWESVFAVNALEPSIGSVNWAALRFDGDIGEHFSWGLTMRGGLLYLDRKAQGTLETVYTVPAYFPYTFTKQWDGAVFSPSNPEGYTAWPDTFAFAGGLLPELNVQLFNDKAHLRLARIRRDWGPAAGGASLVLNAQARPVPAFEGSVTPFPWMGFSFLTGALECYREDEPWPERYFTGMYSLAGVELNAGRYWHIDFGGAAVWPRQTNAAFYADLEFRLPGVFRIWGSLFVDDLDFESFQSGNFSASNRNIYAYQAGLKSTVKWLPFAAFTIRYTKIEPYCYTYEYTDSPGKWTPSAAAYLNGGESLGYYLPPNSDELLFRLESLLSPGVKGHLQLQATRHGVDFGYGAVDGSSLRDGIGQAANTSKYFLMDGVYRWDTTIKLGVSRDLKIGGVPLAVFAEAGLVITRFTTNGDAGVGNEGAYEIFSDTVYQSGTAFICSIGFKLFP
jgi:hypothetical protein